MGTEDWGLISEDIIFEKCITVNSLNSTKSQCDFIQSAPDCEDTDGLLNYVELVYCTIGSDRQLESIVVLVVLLLFFFIGLGVTADDFLCPSLLVISKTLKLSQNIAGVTFLAFGNGAPDIFSSLAGIKKARAELVIGELFGAGIFVTTVVTGIIYLSFDFKLMERPLLRDLAFYMLATYLTWYIFYNGIIDVRHAISFIAIYIIYIGVVVAGRKIYAKYRKPKDSTVGYGTFPTSNLHNEEATANTNPSDVTNWIHSSQRRHTHTPSHSRHPVHHHHTNAIYSITHEHDREPLPSTSSLPERVTSYVSNCHNHTKIYIRHSSVSQVSVTSFTSLLSNESIFHTESQWQEFLIHIFPIDIDNWRESSLFNKIFHVLKAPVYFLLTITIPVVDYECHKNNWCRILNSIHCVTGPLCILILTGNLFELLDTIPIALIVFFVSGIIGLTVYFTSKFDEAPLYHWAFGYFGFCVSVMWIYGLANEVVDMLQAIGIMFSLSDVILGLTLLAWGNSLSDLISNISMARQGFPRMGLSACFDLLLGIGLPYALFLYENGGTLSLEYSRMVTLLYSTVTFSLISTLIVIPCSGFKSKKSHGFFLIFLYIIYVILAVLIEFNFI